MFRVFLAAIVVVVTVQSSWAQASTKPSKQEGAPPGQTTTPPPPAARKARQVRRPLPVIVDERTSAPQVVTILHRLNGLKMFRLLLRSGEGIGAISKIDDAFKIKDEVHTSVIAGLAMGDGETIAARLPQADAELGPAMAPAAPVAPSALPPPGGSNAPALAESGLLGMGNLFDRPDLTVIGRDGKRVVARYVGLDGVTGLSVLKLSGASSLLDVTNKEIPVAVGQRVRVLGPEPVEQVDSRPSRIHVRIGETEGKVVGVTRAPSGSLARIKITSSDLSNANIGAIAINDAGDTVGIVEAIDKGHATLLPNAMVQSAARRVLEKQASVPRPWLGIRGEPLGTFPLEQMVRSGWQAEKAKSLWQHHSGIFLTSVAPNSPAAGAALRPGDVILKVNQGEVKNADEFSWSLEEVSAGDSVNFTVARPGQPATEAVDVTLSSGPVGFVGSTENEDFNTEVNVERIVRSFTGAANSLAAMLMSEGIETIALKPPVALRFGAGSGLLVVYVNPATMAYKAGLRTGDVIEAINGQALISNAFKPVITASSGYSLNVVRNREKLVVKILK